MTPLSETIAAYAVVGLVTCAGFLAVIIGRETYHRIRKG